MQAYRIDRFGSVDGIVLRSSEDPRPGPKKILMRVCASSLNYRDLMVLKGGGRGPTRIGVVPLSDGAGEVAAIGEGVTRVRIGDRIAGCFHRRQNAQGGETRLSCFVGDVEPSLGEQILDVSVAEREAQVEPDRMLDDNWRKPVTTI